jgi:transcriptional regulator CtsR
MMVKKRQDSFAREVVRLGVQTLADQIEAHLLRLLAAQARVELQRTHLAHMFDCAPSQINYVLDTRFTPARGYLVESRRGGGGFIRLMRVPAEAGAALAELPARISQTEAEHVIDRLLGEGLCAPAAAAVMRAAVDREAIGLPLPLRDEVRGRLLRAMAEACLRARALSDGGERDP